MTNKRDHADDTVGVSSVHRGGGATAPVTAHASAGESKGIAGLFVVKDTDFSKNSVGAAAASATACESEGNLGLRQVIESHSRVNSSMDAERVRSASAAVAPCAAAVALTCPLASGAVVAVHARNTVTPVYIAHNSGRAGGLLLVQGSTSYSLGGGRKGPTGRRSTKGGVSGPARELRPVSEVESGVNFRPAGRIRNRLQVHFSVGNQAQVPGASGKVRSHLPSTRRLLIPKNGTPGRGLGIRQSMGWTKVCETAQSGIWVLKGVARACMLPVNLDHLWVG